MSHPDPTQEYPCEICGEQPDDCECGQDKSSLYPDFPSDKVQEEPKNQFEIAVEAYIAGAGILPQIDTALRQAFLAGVQHGINTAQKIYRPEETK